MARKGVFPIVATLAVVCVVLAVFSQTVMRDSNISTNTMTTEQAYADLSGKMKRIGVQEVSVNPQQLDVSEFLDAKDELPDIDSSYPFVVEGNGDVNIEIFSSGEKAAESGSDSFLTSMAKKFNAQHNKTSGDKTMSVSLRSVPSGTAAEYISTGKYQPECYTPSNTLFGELVKNEGVELTVEADRLTGNVAGILVSKKTGDMLRSEYGEASVSSVLNATIDGKLMMGYSNPYTSATGLNFLLAALASSGSDTIVDTAAVENFQKFQANVPLVSFTTQQMVQSADKGIVDGVVMEYQSYQNDPTLQRNYEFIPFGVRHDNPLYSIGNVSAEKKEVIAAFVSFCAQNQAEATKDGFNGLDDYAYTGKVYDGNKDLPAQIIRMAAPETAETAGSDINMTPETAATEYNYIYFRYNNQWVTGKLISYEVVDDGKNIKFTVEGNSEASYYISMANVVLMHKDEDNTRTQNIYEKLAKGTTYG